MAYSRNKVPFKGTVTLKAIFSDVNGDPIDVDDIAAVEVATYSPKDWASFDDLDLEIEGDFPNATNDLLGDAGPDPANQPGAQWNAGLGLTYGVQKLVKLN